LDGDVASAAPTGAQTSSQWREIACGVAAGAVGTLVGFAAVAVARHGVGERPLLEAAILVAAVVVAVLPFRYALGVAVFVSMFQGFMLDFVGEQSLYWNELFTVGILVRSLYFKRPDRRELLIVVAGIAVYAGYLVTGSSVSAGVWGAKVTFGSVVVAWMLARLGNLGRGEFHSVVFGLGAGAAANLVLAVWQRSLGVSGLADLGLQYGERIRETAAGGVIRSSGGFTTAAPLSYALAITLCCWASLLLAGDGHRRVALATAWLPPVALGAIYLSVDRTAVIALLVALAVVWASVKRRVAVAGGASAVAVGAAAFAIVSPGHFGAELGSAAHARLALWKHYLADFGVRGAGPATAGSGYQKVEPGGWVRPFAVPQGWRVRYDRIDLSSNPELALARTPVSPRPPLRVQAIVTAVGVPRRMTVTMGYDPSQGRQLLGKTLRVGRPTEVTIAIPAGRDSNVPLWFTLAAADDPSTRDVAGVPAATLRKLRVLGLPPPRTPAERIWNSWFDKTPAALQSDRPGLVDNIYVSWVYQYGVLGIAFCCLWLAALLLPFRQRRGEAAVLAAIGTGVVLAAAGIAVNVWEEAPTDFLAAIVFACALGRPAAN